MAISEFINRQLQLHHMTRKDLADRLGLYGSRITRMLCKDDRQLSLEEVALLSAGLFWGHRHLFTQLAPWKQGLARLLHRLQSVPAEIPQKERWGSELQMQRQLSQVHQPHMHVLIDPECRIFGWYLGTQFEPSLREEVEVYYAIHLHGTQEPQARSMQGVMVHHHPEHAYFKLVEVHHHQAHHPLHDSGLSPVGRTYLQLPIPECHAGRSIDHAGRTVRLNSNGKCTLEIELQADLNLTLQHVEEAINALAGQVVLQQVSGVEAAPALQREQVV